MSIRLGVGAIFKNESHIIEEWIRHYLREGVDKFFLIDNGSSQEFDSTKILQKYKDICVVYQDPQQYRQTQHYNKYIMKHINEVDWMIIVDLDEFMYARGYDTIKDYLITIPKEISQIKTIWKIFSSNNFIFQPPLVVPYFVSIGRYDRQTKSVFRTSDIQYIDLHASIMKRGYNAYPIKIHKPECIEKTLLCDCPNYCKEGDPELYKNFNKINNHLLHLNHYQIQSWEFFRNVKVTRGDCYHKSLESFKNEKHYFNSADKNIMTDEELKIKHYTNSLGL
jgi:hypothetical protein